jgi:hypothetical protein
MYHRKMNVAEQRDADKSVERDNRRNDRRCQHIVASHEHQSQQQRLPRRNDLSSHKRYNNNNNNNNNTRQHQTTPDNNTNQQHRTSCTILAKTIRPYFATNMETHKSERSGKQ